MLRTANTRRERKAHAAIQLNHFQNVNGSKALQQICSRFLLNLIYLNMPPQKNPHVANTVSTVLKCILQVYSMQSLYLVIQHSH